MKNLTKSLGVIMLATIIVSGVVYAGSLTPPSTISPQSYTLSDIYNKIVSNTTPSTHSLTGPSTVAGTFRTLTEIYNSIPGTQVISPSSTVVPVGINRTATTLNSIDTDLVASKIKAGEEIFGVRGTYTGGSGGPLILSNMGVSSSCYSNTLIGQLPSGYTCNTNSITASYRRLSGWGAVEYCAHLSANGLSTSTSVVGIWRLPTAAELLSNTDLFATHIREKNTAWALAHPGQAFFVGIWSSTEGGLYLNRYTSRYMFNNGTVILGALGDTSGIICVK